MLYRDIIAVCSGIQTKHINTLCVQKVGFLNIKSCGIYSKNIGLKPEFYATYTNIQFIPCSKQYAFVLQNGRLMLQT